MYLLHIKWKEMEYTITCQQIVCPYIYRWHLGWGQKYFFSESCLSYKWEWNREHNESKYLTLLHVYDPLMGKSVQFFFLKNVVLHIKLKVKTYITLCKLNVWPCGHPWPFWLGKKVKHWNCAYTVLVKNIFFSLFSAIGGHFSLQNGMRTLWILRYCNMEFRRFLRETPQK